MMRPPGLLRTFVAQTTPLCATCARLLGRKAPQNICCAPVIGGPGRRPYLCLMAGPLQPRQWQHKLSLRHKGYDEPDCCLAPPATVQHACTPKSSTTSLALPRSNLRLIRATSSPHAPHNLGTTKGSTRRCTVEEGSGRECPESWSEVDRMFVVTAASRTRPPNTSAAPARPDLPNRRREVCELNRRCCRGGSPAGAFGESALPTESLRPRLAPRLSAGRPHMARSVGMARRVRAAMALRPVLQETAAEACS